MDGNPTVLGDYVSLVRGTTYKGALLGQPGPVLLGLATIAPEGGFRSDNYRTYGGDSPERLLLNPGDVYVSLKDVTQSGSLLGAVARLPAHIEQGRLTQDTVKLVKTEKNVDLNYIYWLLRSPQFRELCKSRATGTTNLGLSRDDFLSFPVPELTPERRIVCHLLSLIDEKIDLNRRTAETLEATARSLFKSWFIDFDPVHARVESSPTLLPKPLSNLFPAAFGNDGLPEGWSREPLLDHARLISGGTPKTDNASFWNGPVLWASAKDVSQCSSLFLTKTDRTITLDGLQGSATRIVPKLSTVVVARGATTGRHCLLGRDMSINQTCYALNTLGDSPFWLACAFDNLIDAVVLGGHGSIFNTITTSTLRSAKVTSAPPEVVTAFERQVAPWFQRILSLLEESETLAAIRKDFLPKVVSGEICLSDVPRAVVAA